MPIQKLGLGMKTVGIFPASGGLGGSTATHLLKIVPGDQVTLIARYPDKTQLLPGADKARIRQASHVRDYRVKVQLPAIDAAHRAGVKHIFYSSLGFALPDKKESLAEVMLAHLESEEHLRKIAAGDPAFTWTSVREGLYHESFPIYTSFWSLQAPTDEICIPHNGDGPGISWVKRDELGEATAKLISQYASLLPAESWPHVNNIVCFTGPRELTLTDTVQMLGKAAGKLVRIREVGFDEWIAQPQILEYFGDREKAKTWATAWDAIRAGETAFVSSTLEQLLGRKPQEFDVAIQDMSFGKYLSRFDDSRQLVRLARRAQLSLSKKEEIYQFQNRMRGFVAALGVIQTRYCSREITAQISRSLDEPWDRKPMKFQDALGRRYPVPLEGFMNFLQFAFKSNVTLHAAVQQCQIWLFTPANSNPGLWYIILKDDWKHISKPGVRLGMSFATQSEEEGGASQYPSRGASATARTDGIPTGPTDNVNSLAGQLMLNEDTIKSVRFGEPLPPWATYDPKTNFKLL
ncbi:uncharacterized protein J7T54_007191 [Emericellopsis cladophorae]|uniref:NmrA-like domain-containing protein n=1 Tax=Emericellopsis cladophorae TaxID=2686198 RepID=A0A9Q0BB56_9HYPO|nr:uncharacterized protein J7T54_007191 [Emericellopsis cladophorae]KAI6778145.1 hypothetical protein J7T54_007191 [Emericellopsis cladophorae]